MFYYILITNMSRSLKRSSG